MNDDPTPIVLPRRFDLMFTSIREKVRERERDSSLRADKTEALFMLDARLSSSFNHRTAKELARSNRARYREAARILSRARDD